MTVGVVFPATPPFRVVPPACGRLAPYHPQAMASVPLSLPQSQQLARTSAETVARCRALAALHLRGRADRLLDGTLAAEASALTATAAVWRELCAEERSRLHAPLGMLSADQLARCLDDAETLALLLWTLGVIEALLPFHLPYDADETLLLRARYAELPSMTESDPEPLPLLPAAEVDQVADGCVSWRWRIELAQRPGSADFSPFGLSRAAWKAYGRGFASRPVSEDYGCGGCGYGELSRERQTEIERIVAARLRAVIWLTEIV